MKSKKNKRGDIAINQLMILIIVIVSVGFVLFFVAQSDAFGFLLKILPDYKFPSEDEVIYSDEKADLVDEAILYAKGNLISTDYVKNKGCKCKDQCDNYAKWIKKYSKEINVNPLLFFALMIQENDCEEDKSGSGCVGLFQICSWQDCANKLGLTENNWETTLLDDEKNIQCGSIILGKKYQEYRNGLKNSNTYKNYPDVKKNVDSCIKRYPKYGEYIGWWAALRAYNGRGCGSTADLDFVEKINSIYKKLEEETK